MTGTAAANSARAGDYTAAEAATHVGETATVTDKVSRVNAASGGNIFIDLGTRDASFTAFVPSKSADKFSDAKQYQGKTISVTGKIETFKEKAEIVVTEPSQITVKEDAAASDGSDSAAPKK
ncbi:MAG: OB-fold nucleic acid binding domain-containing protein [Verrucomicrobiota bacterium]|nr:OB-fold nucleic acid binding domain-containing protein [Verrucomicrobiota bacterium]